MADPAELISNYRYAVRVAQERLSSATAAAEQHAADALFAALHPQAPLSAKCEAAVDRIVDRAMSAPASIASAEAEKLVDNLIVEARGYERLADVYNDELLRDARAAVLARMAHPDRAVLDAADIANRAVLAWISELMDAKPDTPEMVMLKRLSDICHAYESVRYPIGEPK